jgi:hypothetical protein
LSHGLQDTPAVDVREHDIEDHQIKVIGHRELMAIEAIACEHDLIPCFPEALLKVIPSLDLVFNNKQSHDFLGMDTYADAGCIRGVTLQVSCVYDCASSG